MPAERITLHRTNVDKTEVIEQYPKTIVSQVYDFDNGKFLNETLNGFTQQLEQIEEGDVLKQVNLVGRGKPTENQLVDDTAYIQEIVTKAAIYHVSGNAVGLTNYYTGNAKAKIPPGFYGISSEISVPLGVDLDVEGAVFVAIPANKTINCFNFNGTGYRNKISGGSFVGFLNAILISTNNRNGSKITLTDTLFHGCETGVSTVSFADSRSTNLKLVNVQTMNTNKLGVFHCDTVHITDSWIEHTGYNGASIVNYGYMQIDNTIFVPRPSQSGARCRWIDNHGVAEIQPGERGLKLSHCRFGGEAGSCPIVFNYLNADTELIGGYAASILELDNCIIFSSGATYGDMAAIVLFAIPNRISIKNCSGISNITKGLITCDSSFNSTTVPTSRLISIYLDSTAKGSTTYPLMDYDLYRFLHTEDSPYNAFRQTFKDGSSFKRYKAISADNTTAKVTLKLKTLSAITTSANQADHGLSFMVNISSSLPGSYAYKANSLYFVSLTGNATKKKLNFTSIASHGGGDTGYTKQATISSVHFGDDYSGNAEVDISSTEENVTIAFNGGSNSTVTVLPIFGVDNYS